VTLRGRLTLLAAAAVAAAIAAASVAAFLITRAELRQQVDTSLVSVAQGFSGLSRLPHGNLSEQDQRLPTIAAQRILPGGSAQPVAGRAIPVDQVDRAVARGERGMVLRDRWAGGIHLRVITAPARGAAKGAWQFGRPLIEQDRTLAQLALVLGLVAVAGVLVSALLGLAVARAGLAPVDRLTNRAEYVARTQDLGALIQVRGNDEIARLARSLNAMLTALDDSRRRQRRLVTDAGHELRTPLTSLRTNIELLVHSSLHPERTLPTHDRRALLADLSAQLHELTGLVADLIDAARDEAGGEVEDIQLADLVAGTVERARLRAPTVCFDADLQPAAVRARRQLLERAVTNVLDNAAKWSPKDGTVEVWLRGGELTVRDHGPGIAAEDLPFVFDRFYRAPAARHMPGSGLGLAIVRETVESHGGTVSATPAPGGGTLVRLRLPASPAAAEAQ